MGLSPCFRTVLIRGATWSVSWNPHLNSGRGVDCVYNDVWAFLRARLRSPLGVVRIDAVPMDQAGAVAKVVFESRGDAETACAELHGALWNERTVEARVLAPVDWGAIPYS